MTSSRMVAAPPINWQVPPLQEELSQVAEGPGPTAEAAAADVAGVDGSRTIEGAKSQSRPNSSSNIANKIAAFASGVAPVKKGIADASEDAITVEDVLHKLEAASRVSLLYSASRPCAIYCATG